MMTPLEWDAFFNEDPKPSNRVIKETIARHVRHHLAGLAPGITITTNELGEAIYPRSIAEKSLIGDITRTEIFRWIGRLAVDGLDDCCVKGEVTGRYMGRPSRPWLWLSPEPGTVCETCGQHLPGRWE